MAERIEDYALIGDCHAAALVSRRGSIDWLCLPRFDSDACFCALLGREEHGHWTIGPRVPAIETRRRYRGQTLVLETEFRTSDGTVRLIDFMALREDHPRVVRIVEGLRGQVPLRADLLVRFGYGAVVPWLDRLENGWSFAGGPNSLALHSSVPMSRNGAAVSADIVIAEGDKASFVLTCYAAHEQPPGDPDAFQLLNDAEQWWQRWVGRCTYQGPWREAVIRSLLTMRALTYPPTGAVVAAATTSLPEDPGHEFNWDYRYSWLRDTTIALTAYINGGYEDEAQRWHDWVIRAVAGRGDQIQPVYGVAGERRLSDTELSWLPGYEWSQPVRCGNGAYQQFQLDVPGEVIGATHRARRDGMAVDECVWRVQLEIISWLEKVWMEPDKSIWESRGRRLQFTHSKVMCWLAFDRSIDAVEQYQLDGPVERWRALRDEIHQQVCEKGFNEKLNFFTQYYGGDSLDAALLVLPQVGFLPADDPRIVGTVEAIRDRLGDGGLVRRYSSEAAPSGMAHSEGAMPLCTCWMANVLAMMGRTEEALQYFENVLEIRNDVGLLSEEYSPEQQRQLGNIPQAFSHAALVNTAVLLSPYVR